MNRELMEDGSRTCEYQLRVIDRKDTSASIAMPHKDTSASIEVLLLVQLYICLVGPEDSDSDSRPGRTDRRDPF
jgi:hypothetical protein